MSGITLSICKEFEKISKFSEANIPDKTTVEAFFYL